jgi:uncharacterized membrane protein
MQKKNIAHLAIILCLIACGLVLIEVIFGLVFVTARIQYVSEGSIETLKFSDMLNDADKLVPFGIALGIQFLCILALPLITSLMVARKGVSRNLMTNASIIVAAIIAMGVLKHATIVMPTGNIDNLIESLTLFTLYQPLVMIASFTMVICVTAFILSVIGISMIEGKAEEKNSTTNSKIELYKKLKKDGDITEEEYNKLLLIEIEKMASN